MSRRTTALAFATSLALGVAACNGTLGRSARAASPPDGKYIVFCSSDQHSPRQSRWSLFLVKTAAKRVIPLFSDFERALFPDWR